MKKILLSFVFLFASLNLNAQSVDPPNGIVTHLINGAYVVDDIYYTTIQQAITAAGTTGIVEIPSNYTGADTYANPNNISIFDYRTSKPSFLNGSITVPTDPTLAYQLTTKHYVDGSIAGITGAKGSPGGYASLDSNGYVLASEIPSMAITQTYVVTSTTAMIALAASVGDVAIVNTGNTATNASYILQSLPATTLANWILLTTPDTGVITINGLVGNVTLGFPNITGTLGCPQLPALTGDITSVGCATTAGGNVALLNGANNFTNRQFISFSQTSSGVIIQAFNPALPSGLMSEIQFGVNDFTDNNAGLFFLYEGNGSGSNEAILGFSQTALAVTPNNAISWDGGTSIPTSSDVCQTSGTNCPSGLVASNYAQLAATSNAFTGSMSVNGGINVGTTGTWNTGSAINITGSNPGLILTDAEATPQQWVLVNGIGTVNNGILGFYNVKNAELPIAMFPATGDVVIGFRGSTPTDNNSALTAYAQANNSAAQFSGANASYTTIGVTNTSSAQGIALFEIGTATPVSTWTTGAGVIEAGTDGGSGANLFLDAFGATSSMLFQINRVNLVSLSSSLFSTNVPVSAPYTFSTGTGEPPASDGTQGAYILWNYNPGGAGSTNFVNLYGGGIGGFTWQNGSSTSALTQIAQLTPAGNFGVSGSFQFGGGTTIASSSSVCQSSGANCPVVPIRTTIAITWSGVGGLTCENFTNISFPGLTSGMVISGSAIVPEPGNSGSTVISGAWNGNGVAGITVCANYSTGQTINFNLLAM